MRLEICAGSSERSCALDRCERARLGCKGESERQQDGQRWLSPAKPSQAEMQNNAPEKGWGQGSAGGRCCAPGISPRRSGPAQPELRGGRGLRCGAAGARGSLGTHGLASAHREATQVIKGTERLISERRLKGLNIYIAWLRAVRGETN